MYYRMLLFTLPDMGSTRSGLAEDQPDGSQRTSGPATLSIV